jgi:hypothetical protein
MTKSNASLLVFAMGADTRLTSPFCGGWFLRYEAAVPTGDDKRSGPHLRLAPIT